MTTQINRLLRLRPTDSAALSRVSESDGAVFYDNTNKTLHIKDKTGNIALASQAWVQAEFSDVIAPDLSAYALKTYVNTAVSTLSNSLATVATSGSYTDLSNKPTIPTDVSQLTDNSNIIGASDFSGDYNDLINKPTLFSGDYNDLTNAPSPYTLPTATTSVLGGVKVDGTTITITNGVISSSGGGSSFDQSLNTTDTVTFAGVTAETLTTSGVGTPTFASGGDIRFNANSGAGQLTVTGDIVLTQAGSIIGGPVYYQGGTGELVLDNTTAGVIAVTGKLAAICWTITAPTAPVAYTFAGPGFTGTVDDPTLYLYRGHTYRFDNTTGSAHPFLIRVSNGGASYTTGVTGSSTGVTYFTVPMDAPSTLYYQCQFHSAMGNTINIV